MKVEGSALLTVTPCPSFFATSAVPLSVIDSDAYCPLKSGRPGSFVRSSSIVFASAFGVTTGRGVGRGPRVGTGVGRPGGVLVGAAAPPMFATMSPVSRTVAS